MAVEAIGEVTAWSRRWFPGTAVKAGWMARFPGVAVKVERMAQFSAASTWRSEALV
jgi:hypothetical protein